MQSRSVTEQASSPTLLVTPPGSSQPDEENSPRHRWYRIKESFSPSWVKEVIASESLTEEDMVLDPFAGSGTVTTTASVVGVRSLAYEVNPFLAFAARTKLARISGQELNRQLPAVREAIQGKTVSSPLVGYSTFARVDGKRGLFNESVLNAFEAGWRVTTNVKPGCKRLLRLALIGAAIDCGNFVRDGKALRYRQALLDCEYNESSLDDALVARVALMVEDLEESSATLKKAGRVKAGDSRVLLNTGQPVSFRLCVTSPPYLNSFDYSDIYRPELFLGRFVSTTSELRKIRLTTVRSHVQASWAKPASADFGQLFAESLKGINERRSELWDQRIPTMVQAYFEDMQSVLRHLLIHGKPNASVWMVVSTSAYAGVEIPVDLILAEIGERCGLLLRTVQVIRRMRSSGQHWQTTAKKISRLPLRESLVVFDLPDGKRKVTLTPTVSRDPSVDARQR